jgi:hypothetical protein
MRSKIDNSVDTNLEGERQGEKGVKDKMWQKIREEKMQLQSGSNKTPLLMSNMQHTQLHNVIHSNKTKHCFGDSNVVDLRF